MSKVNTAVRPLGQELARELTMEELNAVGGGAATRSTTGKISNGGDWEVSVTIDW